MAPAPSMPAAGSGVVSVPPRPVAATAFRVTRLRLYDPHLYLGATDITEQPVLGVSVNGALIPDALTTDADDDGHLDLSIILLLSPFDPSAPTAELTLVEAHCPVSGTTACSRSPTSALQTVFRAENHAAGTCSTTLPPPNTVGQPALVLPSAPCYAAVAASSLTINLGGIAIPVIAGQMSAAYRTQPSARLVSGLIGGFVTREVAMRAILPPQTQPPLAGTALSDYVRLRDYDLASSPTMQDGFWLYMTFEAEPINYTP
ncbi:MAG: hypothetical protein ABW321_27200 [Polyangiales bacterium]